MLVDLPLDRPRGPAPALLFREQHVHELPPPREPRLQVLRHRIRQRAHRRPHHLGDGWIPSFIAPEPFRAGVEKTCAFAAEAGREVPGDHFGALLNFWLDDDPARARALAAPFIPRGRVDEATLAACTAFGPAEVVRERLEQYVAGGGSKFVLRPMGPSERMLEQLERLAAEVIPTFHQR